MPQIRVPRNGLRGMVTLANWSDTQFSNFLAAIEKSPAEVPFQSTASKLAQEIVGSSLEEAATFATMLQSIQVTKTSFPGNNDAYLAELLASIKNSIDKENKPSEAQLKILSERLPQLISAPKIAVGSKATDLLFERDRLASDFRILTDARPIFSDTEQCSPDFFLLIHSLKIEYQEGEQTKDFYIAIDETDLTKLIDTCSRALSKGQALRERFQKCSIEVINVRADE